MSSKTKDRLFLFLSLLLPAVMLILSFNFPGPIQPPTYEELTGQLRPTRPPVDLSGSTAVISDDGTVDTRVFWEIPDEERVELTFVIDPETDEVETDSVEIDQLDADSQEETTDDESTESDDLSEETDPTSQE